MRLAEQIFSEAMMSKSSTKALPMVDVLKFRTPLLFLNKMLIFRAGTHKIVVRIANREDHELTACTEAV